LRRGAGALKRRAYIGLGSNLGASERQVSQALADLARLGALRASSLYWTEPLGDPAQPWYVNAVAELETEFEPLELLDRLQALEQAAGRPPRGGPPWQPRRLDLDLLLVEGVELVSERLTLPHPELARRRFVLEPLCEIAPEIRDPRTGSRVRDLLRDLDDPLRVEKLSCTPESKSDGTSCAGGCADIRTDIDDIESDDIESERRNRPEAQSR